MAVGENVDGTVLLARRIEHANGSSVAVGAKSEGKLINRILIAALILGGSIDILFYKKATGISTLVFVGLIVTTLAAFGITEKVKVAWRNLWLVIPLFLFAGLVSVRANPELTLMNLGATIVLLLLFIYFFTGGRVEALGVLGYPLTAARMIRESLSRPTPIARSMAKQAASNSNQNRRVVEILRGLVIAIPILVLFTILLSQADSIFQGLVTNFIQFRYMSDAPEAFLRISIILVSAWAIAGALLHTLRPMPNAAHVSGPPTVALKNRGLSYVEGALVLVLVNGLFAVFAWIQFTVLFSGQAARTMGFEEYREYVRRGFGELLVVALLTMVLILGLRRFMRRATEGQERSLNMLNTLMIGLAMTLLVSAFARMVIWENIQFYINTATRLYVRTFIVCLGALFVWLLLTTWFRRDRFAIGALLATLAFISTANYINPDADVAAYNLKRNDELSTRYLYLLSDDAVPALVAGLDSTTDTVRNALRSNLQFRLQEMQRNPQWQDWQSFHFSRWAAYNALIGLRDRGEIEGLSPPPPTTNNTQLPTIDAGYSPTNTLYSTANTTSPTHNHPTRYKLDANFQR